MVLLDPAGANNVFYIGEHSTLAILSVIGGIKWQSEIKTPLRQTKSSHSTFYSL